MHPKERYEEIITGKLAALPVPDMADAIWLRIERQLDIDLPSDDGGDVPEPPSPWSGGGMAIGAGFLAVVGAILALFYLQQPNKPTNNTTPINTTTETQTPVRNTRSTTEPPPPETPSIEGATNPPVAAEDLPAALPEAPISDLVTTTPLPDSSIAVADNLTAQSGTSTPALQPDTKPDTIPKKKRGLQNVTDKDYRIVPKNNNIP